MRRGGCWSRRFRPPDAVYSVRVRTKLAQRGRACCESACWLCALGGCPPQRHLARSSRRCLRTVCVKILPKPQIKSDLFCAAIDWCTESSEHPCSVPPHTSLHARAGGARAQPTTGAARSGSAGPALRSAGGVSRQRCRVARRLPSDMRHIRQARARASHAMLGAASRRRRRPWVRHTALTERQLHPYSRFLL